MPTRFLSSHQRAIYGRFAKDPSEDDLARFFLIETADHKIIQQLRGSTNRLGFAILLCGLKYTGSFIRNWEDVPEIVVTYLASQLAVESTIDLASYFDHAAPTYKRHCSMIRAHLGVRDLYSSRKALFGLTRRLYTLCWTGEDRPSHLMQWVIDWLMANAILLPGVTTLERLVGRVKDRVQTRLFQKLVEGLTAQQRQQIHDLLNATGGWAELELLRSSPLKRTQSAFLNHLDRLDALRSFGLQLTPPKGVPARVLEKVARRTRAMRTSAIYAYEIALPESVATGGLRPLRDNSFEWDL